MPTMGWVHPTIECIGRVRAVLSWLAIIAVIAVSGANEAHAGKFDNTLDLSLHVRGSSFNAGTLGLRASRTAPSLVTDATPRLAGRGRSIATIMRFNASLQGLRFGVGAGYQSLTGLRLDRDTLPSGYRIDEGRVGALPLEGFVGYALGSAEHVRPYVEMRTTATVVLAQARLSHHQDGDLGKFRLHATAFDLVGRAGVLVPLGEFFFLDASVGRTIRGPGAWVASFGFGIPIPTDNL